MDIRSSIWLALQNCGRDRTSNITDFAGRRRRVTRPRLLFVSPRFLFPLDEGGKIRTTGVLRAMKGGAFDITVVSPAPPDAARYRMEMGGVADRFVSWPEHRAGTVARAAAVFSTLPVSVAVDRSAAGRRAVEAEIAAADVLVADFPHSAV